MTSVPFEFLTYETLDSTNEEAKRLLAAGHIIHPTIIRANSQTAGKGTQGRSWISPPGAGLYFSIVHPFRKEADWQHLPGTIPLTPLFTLAAGVACARTIRELTGLSIQLKPINDLYVEGRKLGGILTESLISQNQCKALITGIGINILYHADIHEGCAANPGQEPTIDRGRNRPTSLQECIPPTLFNQWQEAAIMQELSHAIAQTVDTWYRTLIEGNSAQVLAEYQLFKLPEIQLPPELTNHINSYGLSQSI